MNLNSSHPRDKSVSCLGGGEVQRQDVSCVTVETLEQLAALHIPQSTCAVAAAGQDLPQTHTHVAQASGENDSAGFYFFTS